MKGKRVEESNIANRISNIKGKRVAGMNIAKH